MILEQSKPSKATDLTVPDKLVSTRAIIEVVQDLGLLVVIGLGALAMSFASPVFLSRLNFEYLLLASTINSVVSMGDAS